MRRIPAGWSPAACGHQLATDVGPVDGVAWRAAEGAQWTQKRSRRQRQQQQQQRKVPGSACGLTSAGRVALPLERGSKRRAGERDASVHGEGRRAGSRNAWSHDAWSHGSGTSTGNDGHHPSLERRTTRMEKPVAVTGIVRSVRGRDVLRGSSRCKLGLRCGADEHRLRRHDELRLRADERHAGRGQQ